VLVGGASGAAQQHSSPNGRWSLHAPYSMLNMAAGDVTCRRQDAEQDDEMKACYGARRPSSTQESLLLVIMKLACVP
jgi:hypothetical protein